MIDESWSWTAGWLRDFGSGLPAVPGYERVMRWAPRSALEPLVHAIRETVVGRRIRATLGSGPVAFTLTAIDAQFDPLGSTVGQAEHVQLRAEDVEYAGLRANRVDVVARNVHTRVAVKPVLVTTPVEITLVMNWAQVEALLQRYARHVRIEARGAQSARLRWAGHPRRGWMDVRVDSRSGQVVVQPISIGWRRRAIIRNLRGMPGLPMPTAIAPNIRVVDVSFGLDSLTVRLLLDEWNCEFGRIWSHVRPGSGRD